MVEGSKKKECKEVSNASFDEDTGMAFNSVKRVEIHLRIL